MNQTNSTTAAQTTTAQTTPTFADRVAATVEICAFIRQALDIVLPDRPVRPQAGTMADIEAYENSLEYFNEINAQRQPCWEAARMLAEEYNIPKGVWIQVEHPTGELLALRIKDGFSAAGQPELRFRMKGWRDQTTV